MSNFSGFFPSTHKVVTVFLYCLHLRLSFTSFLVYDFIQWHLIYLRISVSSFCINPSSMRLFLPPSLHLSIPLTSSYHFLFLSSILPPSLPHPFTFLVSRRASRDVLLSPSNDLHVTPTCASYVTAATSPNSTATNYITQTARG